MNTLYHRLHVLVLFIINLAVVLWLPDIAVAFIVGEVIAQTVVTIYSLGELQ